MKKRFFKNTKINKTSFLTKKSPSIHSNIACFLDNILKLSGIWSSQVEDLPNAKKNKFIFLKNIKLVEDLFEIIKIFGGLEFKGYFNKFSSNFIDQLFEIKIKTHFFQCLAWQNNDKPDQNE